MACLGRGDWIVPRRLMCFLFWTGTMLLFIGILLVVTSKHKGQVFSSWGAVLLSLGSCILIVCLVLCIHAYYVIAESRNSAEHTIINHLTLQRKAQHSVPPSSSDIWEPKLDSFSDVPARDTRIDANGRYPTTQLRQGMGPIENGISARYQSFPPERKGEKEAVVCGGGMRVVDFAALTGTAAESKGEDGTVDRTYQDTDFFRPPPSHDLLPPPPSYSSQFSPQSSSFSGLKLMDSTSPPPPPVVVSPMQASDARLESRDLEETSARIPGKSPPPQPKNFSPGSPVPMATRDNQQHLWRQPPPNQIPDFRNTSSQSSAPNSSTEIDPETTDLEVSHALESSSAGRHSKPHQEIRLLNNTPVDSYQTDAGAPGAESLPPHRPPRLNFEPLTYDSDGYVDRVDKGEAAAAGMRRITSTLPSGSRGDVWASESPQVGPRRHPGSESITRPFGHGTVTVTPLYRTPKIPPSGRQKTAAAGVTVRTSEAVRSLAPTGTAGRSPTLGRGGTSVVVSVRNPEVQRNSTFGRRTVPTVSVTPCITDRETDIGVCQSDVTVYDNVIDTVKM